MIKRKRLIKWEEKFKEFVLRQLSNYNLATIEWKLERKLTEVDDIKQDLILARTHGWLAVMVSVHDEFTSSLLDNIQIVLEY